MRFVVQTCLLITFAGGLGATAACSQEPGSKAHDKTNAEPTQQGDTTSFKQPQVQPQGRQDKRLPQGPRARPGLMFERLGQGSSRCEETRTCLDIADTFEGLDHDALCSANLPQPGATPMTKSSRDIEATVASKRLKCRVTQLMRMCSITCFDPLPETDLDAVYSAQEQYIQHLRNTYGVERFTDVQGHPRFPRYNYRWRSADTSLHVVVRVSDPDSANPRSEIRTHYHAQRRSP